MDHFRLGTSSPDEVNHHFHHALQHHHLHHPGSLDDTNNALQSLVDRQQRLDILRDDVLIDPEWQEFLEKRHTTTCTKSCRRLNGEVVMSTRLSMLERTKEERDLMLLAFISMLTAQGAPTKRGKDRKHWTMKYQFQRTPICRETFLFAYGTTDKVLKSLMHHYKEHGLTPRVHGNKGKKVHHSLSGEKVTTVVTWITNFANREGTQVQNPRGRVRIVIPSTYTQRGLHRMYIENCQEHNMDYVGRSTFLALWRQRCDHIAVAKGKKSEGTTVRGGSSVVGTGRKRRLADDDGPGSTNMIARRVKMQAPGPPSPKFTLYV